MEMFYQDIKQKQSETIKTLIEIGSTVMLNPNKNKTDKRERWNPKLKI